MLSGLTIVYAILALIGGAAGARLTGASVTSGLVVAAMGFLASVAAQVAGAPPLLGFLAYVVVAAGIALLFRLTPLQVVGVVAGAVVVSFLGGLLIGVGMGVEHAGETRPAP